MYFIVEIRFSSKKNYIANLIRAYAKKEKIDVDVLQSNNRIHLIFDKEDKKIEGFLLKLENILPASLFLGKIKHYFSKEKLDLMPLPQQNLPLNIAPCPTCQKEMFDVSSRRYYYPFTACNNCGSQHPFLTSYPYIRENTTMKFLRPCELCEKESKSNFLRLDYPLISCIECGIAIRMVDKKSKDLTTHLAIDKGELRKLFEVSAKAITANKTILVKTNNGYRKFFKPSKTYCPYDSILLITNANQINKHLMMIEQEFNAILSIERPLLMVSTKGDEIKEFFKSSVLSKYPDEGMTMLLAKELMSLEEDYICYIECESNEESDFLIDFDVPINTQKDTKIFLNQDDKFFISGERILYPAQVEKKKKRVSIAHNLASVNVGQYNIIDSIDVFANINTQKLYILDSENTKLPKENTFNKYEASMMSVLAEYNKIGQKAIGVHFDGSLNFLYYNGKKIINAIPSIPFESDNLWEKISTLRDGSDRLVNNYKKAYPKIWERLDSLGGDMDIFEVTAITLGLKNESFEGISAKALSFLGKGGLQIDTRVKENNFDNYAFLTSIMSYQLGDVENDFLAYSIYESFGDYIGEIVPQLAEKVKSDIVVLNGETFANQSLYTRIVRVLGKYRPIISKSFPIGKQNAVYGGMWV